MRRWTLALCVPFAFGLTACEASPRSTHIQWVARDAWSPTCADKAIVERWVQSEGRWKVKGEIWTVEVDATFKLGNDCDGGLLGKSFKAYESVEFQKKNLELSRCKKDGAEGWSLPGQESKRCWTGPSLLGS